MPLANAKLIILDNVEWSLDSASISAELDLLSCKVSHDRNLSLDTTITSQSEEVLVQAMGIARQTDPVAIDEDFRHVLIAQVLSGQLFKLLYTPILQLVDDVSRITTD